MFTNETYLVLEWFLFIGLFILGGIFYLKYKHNKTNNSFVFLCASLLLHILFNISLITGYIKNVSILIPLDQINGQLFAFLLVYHIKDITKINIKPTVLYISTIIGSMVAVYYYIVFLNLDISNRSIFYDELINVHTSKIFLVPIIFIQLSDVISAIYLVVINIKFKNSFNIYLSEDNRKSYQYTLLFTTVSAILLLFCILFILFLPKQFAQFVMIPSVYYFLFFSSFILYSGIPILELNQNKQIADELVNSNGNEKIEDDKNLTNQINNLILEKQLYKKLDFTLFDLAKELSISTKQLSHFINHNLNTNFATLINKYRIEEAKKLLNEKQNLTFDAIAELAGFRNRITFYRAFKKIENISPSEFKN